MLNLNISRSFHLLLTGCGVANFHNMKFLDRFTGFLFTETEQTVFVTCIITYRYVGESGGKTLQNLLLSFLGEKKLHVATNLVIRSLINANQVTPFVRRVNTIVHDLSVGKLGFLVKNLCWSSLIIDIAMINRSLSNNS